MPNVYILTWCKSLESLYGSLLVFQTLRVGFPTSSIFVFDNGSLPEAREAIREAAVRAGAVFTQVKREVPHHVFLNEMINRQRDGAAVFVDPDVCFWSNVESWRFDALFAGRRIPRHRSEVSGGIVHPRAHTSLFWVPDVRKLREAISDVRHHESLFGYDPFRPIMFRFNGTWHHFDTGASLAATFPDGVHFFSERDLECYDHLFVGSHLSWVSPKLANDALDLLRGLHSDVQRDHNTLRGAWRGQETYFAARQVHTASGGPDDVGAGLTSIIMPCWNQLELTRQCIAALKAHTRRPWELIVIDNGSTDHTDIYLAGLREGAGVPVTVISNMTNRGFPAAINQGLEIARGEYLVMLNNDVVVTDGWLDQMIALANAKTDRFTAEIAENAERKTETENGDVGVGTGGPRGARTSRPPPAGSVIACAESTPPVPPSRGGAMCSAGGQPSARALSSVTNAYGQPPTPKAIGLVGPMSNYAAPPQLVENVPYQDLPAMHKFARQWRAEHRGKWFTTGKLSGFCLLLKRAVYEKVGGLDERFGLDFFDDDDYCRRARSAGFELAVAHDLFVHHFGSRTFQGNGVDAGTLLDENARRFAEKWGPAGTEGRRVRLRPWVESAVPHVNSDGEKEGEAKEDLTPSRKAAKKDANGLGRSSSRGPENAVRGDEPSVPHAARDQGHQVPLAALRLGVRSSSSMARDGAVATGGRARVSLTMIVRDEEDHLGRCLESVRGLFDEIVIVDTGSVDRTKEIAHEFGAKVFDFVWSDDFAAARNEALAHATGDYAFWLDADDVVEPEQRERLRALLDSLAAPVARSAADETAEAMAVGLHDPADRSTAPYAIADAAAAEWESGLDQTARGRNPRRRDLRSALTELRPSEWRPAAYVVRCACASGPDGKRGGTVVDHVRLFPIRVGVRWSYRVHEQILPSLKRAKIPVKWTDLVVTHTGYIDAEDESRKLDRNIKILKVEVEEKPNDPFVLFNLGMSAVERHQWPEARAYLERSLAGSAPADSIVRKIYALLARVHQSTGDLQAAMRTCDEGLKLDPEDAELWHRKAVAHRHRREPAEAERCWRRILGLKRPEQFCSFDQGLYGHITRRNLAALAAERGDLAEAERLYGEVLAECPGDCEAVAKLGQLKSRPGMADVHPALGLTPRL